VGTHQPPQTRFWINCGIQFWHSASLLVFLIEHGLVQPAIVSRIYDQGGQRVSKSHVDTRY